MKSLKMKCLYIYIRCIYLSNISIIKRFSLYLMRTSCMRNDIFQHKNGYGGHFVFLNEPKFIPREGLLTRNIPSKIKKTSSGGYDHFLQSMIYTNHTEKQVTRVISL